RRPLCLVHEPLALLEPTPLLALALTLEVLAGANKVEVQLRRLRRVLRPACRPRFGRCDIIARQQPIRWPATPVPLDRAMKVAGVLAQPIEIGVESRDQAHETGAEARTGCFGVRIEKDVVAVPQTRRRARALHRAAVNGEDALAESRRLLHLPGTDFGARRGRRQHENYRVGLADQGAEASLPVLATGDAVAVDRALKAVKIECRIELVREVQVLAAVGDEDAKLAPIERIRPARLLWTYVTRFQRRRTGCVLRDVCHCAAPIAALNIAY